MKNKLLKIIYNQIKNVEEIDYGYFYPDNKSNKISLFEERNPINNVVTIIDESSLSKYSYTLPPSISAKLKEPINNETITIWFEDEPSIRVKKRYEKKTCKTPVLMTLSSQNQQELKRNFLQKLFNLKSPKSNPKDTPLTFTEYINYIERIPSYEIYSGQVSETIDEETFLDIKNQILAKINQLHQKKIADQILLEHNKLLKDIEIIEKRFNQIDNNERETS